MGELLVEVDALGRRNLFQLADHFVDNWPLSRVDLECLLWKQHTDTHWSVAVSITEREVWEEVQEEGRTGQEGRGSGKGLSGRGVGERGNEGWNYGVRWRGRGESVE